MVTHIVLFRVRQKADMSKVRDLLLSMKGKIPVMKSIEVSFNFVERPVNFDVVLIVKLENAEDVTTYLNDPVHMKVSEELETICSHRCAVDFMPMPS